MFVLLDVYGSYYFAPSFTSFDHYTLDLQSGMTSQDVIPAFTWPSGAGTASGVQFYAGMTDSGMTRIIGQYDRFEFGWSE